MRCAICGVSGDKVRLFEAISLKEKGIIKICEACSKRENIPIVKRPTTFQLKKAEKSTQSSKVYDMLADARKQKSNFKSDVIKEFEKKQEDVNLKKIVDRNYEKFVPLEKKPRPDLVDNFHWIIMRARRLRKLTQEQLAQELSESEAAIKMAEQGILPEDDHRLVSKLESFLGINLRKGTGKKSDEIKKYVERAYSGIPEEAPTRIIKFDPVMAKNITIADLRKMKEEVSEGKELGNFEEAADSLEGNTDEEKEREKEDFSRPK